MTPHDFDEDELLAAAAAGERREDDPELAALLLRDPAARERLRRLHELAAGLDHAGAEQRELLAGRGPVPPSHEQIVTREVARWRPRRSPWGLLLAAALLVGGGLFVFFATLPRAANEDDRLGPDAGKAHPVGTVAQYDAFSWNLALPARGWFDLVFLDPDDGHELFRVPGLTTRRWVPDAAKLSLMPDHLAWRVDAMEPGLGAKASDGPHVVQRR